MGKKIDADWLLQKTDIIIEKMKKKKYAGIGTDVIPMFMNKMIEAYDKSNSIDKEVNKKELIEEIINTIYEEIENSGDSYYVTKENQEFSADVGYVKEWLDDYKEVLRKRYS